MQLPVLAPAQKVAVGGSLLALAGSVLPWIASEGGSIAGVDADGFLTLMAAVTVLGIVTLWEWDRRQMLGVMVFGGIIAVVATDFLFTMEAARSAANGAIEPGVGIYLTILAGILTGGAGVYGLFEREPTVTDPDPDEELAGSNGER